MSAAQSIGTLASRLTDGKSFTAFWVRGSKRLELSIGSTSRR